MYEVRITSRHGTWIDKIICNTIYQAYSVKSRLLAMGLKASVYSVLSFKGSVL